MSAIVCGKRSSSFFEELQYNHTSPPPSAAVVSKRIRCSTSPIRLSPPRTPSFPSAVSLQTIPTLADNCNSRNSRNQTSHLAHLRSLFPDMDEQLLERALEASGDDLDSAIKSLTGLCLGSTEGTMDSSASSSIAEINTNIQLPPVGMDGAETHSHVQDCNLTNIVADYGGNTFSENPSADLPANLPVDGAEWVEVFVREMMNASDMDDARARASRVLEVLEKSIMARASAESEQTFHKEYMMLKEQVEGLLRDNNILKRAVSIQHERQKEYDERNQELKHLKQLVSQYQEQLRTLEVNNYALTMHLRQAQQSSSIPGRFHPDVF